MRISAASGWLLLFAFLQIFFAFSLPAAHHRTFYGYETLVWQGSPACQARIGTELSADILSLSNVGTNDELHCVSQWFHRGASGFAVEYAGTDESAHAVEIFLEQKINGAVQRTKFPLPRSISEKHWSKELRTLDPRAGEFRLELNVGPSAPQWFGLRSRLELINTELPAASDSGYMLATFLLTALGVTAVGLAMLFTAARRGLSELFLCYLPIVILIHFRFLNNFYADDWTFLEQASSSGLSNLFATHNEHILPVFRLLFWLESRLFGGSYGYYLFVSAALHAATSAMLAKFLRKLLPACRGVGELVGLLFAVNGLHAEALQWVVAQSTLLVGFFFAASLLMLVRVAETGGYRDRLLFLVCIVLGGLSFAGGLILPALLCWCVLWLPPLSEEVPQIRKRLAALTGAALALLLLIYRHGAASDIPIDGVLRYLLTGAFFGTITRGLGLVPFWFSVPFTERGELEHFVRWLPGTLRHMAGFSGAVVLPGLLLSFGYLLIAFFAGSERRTLMRYWILGQGVILGSFVLQAIGRVQFGPFQSLAERYQYLPLIGLAIMLAPLVAHLLHVRDAGVAFSFRAALFQPLVAGYVFAQLWLAQGMSYYSARGTETTYFLAAVKHWEPPSAEDYEGRSRAVHGLQPLYYHHRGSVDVQQPPPLHPVEMLRLVSPAGAS